MDDAVLFHDILCVENVGLPEEVFEFGAEFVQGGVPLIGGALHLYGADSAIAPDEEVNLHLVLSAVPVDTRVEVEVSARSP